MKFFTVAKDGGPESHVTGFFFVEIKWLFSVVLLHFAEGTRETYHSHAFNAITRWMHGEVLEEYPVNGSQVWWPGQWKYTPRNLKHRIRAFKDSWAISFRGPWRKTWEEYNPQTKETSVLTHGRKVVA